MLQVVSTQTTLPLSLHAGGRVLQSVTENAGINATSGWNLSDWPPQPQPSPSALAPIPLKSAAKASSTKAVALQHLKVHAPGLFGGVLNTLFIAQFNMAERCPEVSSKHLSLALYSCSEWLKT